MVGANEQKLREHLSGSRVWQVFTAEFQWSQGEKALQKVADAIEDARPVAKRNLGRHTADQADKAFVAMNAKVKERQEQLKKGAEALGEAKAAITRAEAVVRGFDADGAISEPTPPEWSDDEIDQIRQLKVHGARMTAYNNAVAEREQAALAAIQDVDATNQSSTATMREIQGKRPQDTGGGGGSSTPAGGGGGLPPPPAAPRRATTTHRRTTRRPTRRSTRPRATPPATRPPLTRRRSTRPPAARSTRRPARPAPANRRCSRHRRPGRSAAWPARSVAAWPAARSGWVPSGPARSAAPARPRRPAPDRSGAPDAPAPPEPWAGSPPRAAPPPAPRPGGAGRRESAPDVAPPVAVPPVAVRAGPRWAVPVAVAGARARTTRRPRSTTSSTTTTGSTTRTPRRV